MVRREPRFNVGALEVCYKNLDRRHGRGQAPLLHKLLSEIRALSGSPMGWE